MQALLQPDTFNFIPVEPTGQPYPIVIQQADFEGGLLSSYDEIGIFDRNLCVGAARVTGEWPLIMTAWEGDPEYDLPGFIPDNPIQFRVWQIATEEENPADATYDMGNGYFGTGPGANLTSLSGWDADEQTVYLDGDRWQLISFNLRPAWPHPENVFGATAPFQIAWNDRDRFWRPVGNPTLQIVDPREGYRVYSSAASRIHMYGTQLPADLTLRLGSGMWNYMPYTLQEPLDPTVALADIQDQIIAVIDDEGRFWLPGIMQTLPLLEPGKAYRVRVSEPVSFQFNQLGRGRNNSANTSLPDLPSAPPVSGIGWPVRVLLDDALLENGADIIEILDGATVVGSARVRPEQGDAVVIAWEGDADHNIPGFTAGNAMRVRVLDSSGRQLANQVDGQIPTFAETPITSISVSADAEILPSEFHVGALTPNPFNPSFTMPLHLPQAATVKIAVYDILGRQVAAETVHAQAGRTVWQFDAGRLGLASGVYIVRVQNGADSIIQKAVLLK